MMIHYWLLLTRDNYKVNQMQQHTPVHYTSTSNLLIGIVNLLIPAVVILAIRKKRLPQGQRRGNLPSILLANNITFLSCLLSLHGVLESLD